MYAKLCSKTLKWLHSSLQHVQILLSWYCFDGITDLQHSIPNLEESISSGAAFLNIPHKPIIGFAFVSDLLL